MSEKQKFLDQHARDKADGLLDIKFLMVHKGNMSEEEFYGAANRFRAAKDEDKTSEFRHKDINVTPQPHPSLRAD